MTLLDVLNNAIAQMSRRFLPDLSTQYGRRFQLGDQHFQLAAQNDLGYPYFVRVVRGKPQKRQYCVPWIEGQLTEENGDPFSTARPCWQREV